MHRTPRLVQLAVAGALAALASVLPGTVLAQSHPGALMLPELLTTLRTANPTLAATRAATDAARLRAPAASALPDPSFQLGLMNLGLPDLNADMAMTMAPSLQLMQAIPFPGKRGLREDMAELDADMAETDAEAMWWALRAQATRHFFDLYRIDQHLQVQRSTLELLGELTTVTRARYSASTGPQADVLRAHVEVARTEGEILRLERDRTATEARLNAMLDQPARTRFGPPVLPPLTASPLSIDSLSAMTAQSSPTIRRALQLVEHGAAAVRLAERDVWPDLIVGVQYGQRDRGTGMERMGSAMLGFTLPVHAGSRQRPLAAAARAETSRAEATLAQVEAEVYAALVEWAAELQRTRSLIDLYRDEILPQARIAVASALSSYRAGQVDFTTLLDAELNVNRFELELYALVRDHGVALATLESVVGQPLPTGSDLLEIP